MNLYLYLLIINALTFAMYWQDKRAAKVRGAARVPEATLLLAGFFGGTGVALVAQRLLRHKTRKQSFQFKFWAITFVQIGLLLFPPDVVKAVLARAFA
jgi:uncharacterized membrane protein YsdA (DUF1294 family)